MIQPTFDKGRPAGYVKDAHYTCTNCPTLRSVCINDAYVISYTGSGQADYIDDDHEPLWCENCGWGCQAV